MDQSQHQTPITVKRHLDLWIGILLGVGVAAALSAIQKLTELGLSVAAFEEIEGRAYFTFTAAVLVGTHIYRTVFASWNGLFIKIQFLVSLLLFGLAVWAQASSFWQSTAIAHLVIIVPFTFLLFSLLAVAESIFTQDLRDKKLVPLWTISLQMIAVFLLIYVGRIVFPPNHVFLTIYLALALFDMTSRSPALNKNERWEPLLSDEV